MPLPHFRLIKLQSRKVLFGRGEALFMPLPHLKIEMGEAGGGNFEAKPNFLSII